MSAHHFCFKCLIVTFLLAFSLITYAQDIHFSQTSSSVLNLSPAETGDFNADHRFVANYRNQWASVTVPYKTFSASYENKQTKWLKKFGNIGLGVLFNSDVAGDGNMGTIQAKFSSAFHYRPLLDSALYMSFGFNVAYNQYSLDYDRLIFDNQYNGTQYDPAIYNNEDFYAERFNFMDVSLGVKFKYFISPSVRADLGLVFNHLNKPKQAFSQVQSNALDGKFNTYLGLEIPLSETWLSKPILFYYWQGKFNELFYGVIFQKQLEHINFRSINFGLFNRTSDALVFRLGFDYQSFDIGFSYDLNYSKLSVASRGVGAFELSLIYLMHNPLRYEYRHNNQCPVFL